MRRLMSVGLVCLGVLLTGLPPAPSAQTATVPGGPASQVRPSQADGVVRVLADLETALRAGRRDLFTALASASIDDESIAVFERSIGPGRPTTATIRERARQPAGNGFEVLVDVLVSHGRRGRIASWILTTRARGISTTHFEIASLTEPAALDQLLRLSLDASKQFAVRDLVLHGTDLVLKMDSGIAFVSEDDGGPTAIVLRGAGEVSFTPPDAAEQGQLKALAGKPTYVTRIDSAFIRLNSSEFQARMSQRSLTPVPVNANELERARAIFEDRSGRTYNLDLRELSPDRWSIAPSMGSLIVEFRTGRFGWLTYARAINDQEDVSLFDRARGRNISSYASTERLATRGPFYSEDAAATFDIERYGLDLTFAPDRRWVQGRASIRLKIVSAVAGTLTFKLAESLTVSSVSSPNFGRLLALRVIGQNNIIVNLPTAVVRGTELVVDIEYSGRVNPQAADREAALPQASAQQREDAPPIVIEPEPRLLYSNQVYWYPQGLVSDYATAAIRLRVPSEYQIIASGSLIRSSVDRVAATEADAREAEPRFHRTVEYSTDRPARYLSCVISRFGPNGQLRVPVPAVAPQIHTALPDSGAIGGSPGVNVEVVSTPRVRARNRQLPARVANMLRVFAGLIGEAPYPDFTVAGVEDNLPGGHSPAFFAIWLQPMPTSPFSWSSDPLSLDSIYPHYFLAHEVAHQWWGQAVGWKNYHEQWLSEGMAQYFSSIYAGTDRGPATMRAMLVQMRESAEMFIGHGPISLGYRLGHVQGDTRVFRSIVYNKAAVVLHMLRRLVGDDAFFAGLRRYYRDFRFKKAGADDLRKALEAESPIPLTRFFRLWIQGSAIPKVRVTTTTAPAGDSATVRIEQIGEVFDFPLTVTVQYADGKSEQVTIPVTAAMVEHKIALSSRLRRIDTKDELTLAEFVR